MDIVSSFIPDQLQKSSYSIERKNSCNIYSLNDTLFIHLKSPNNVQLWKEKTRDLIKKDADEILFLGLGKYTEKGNKPDGILVEDHVNVSGTNPLIGKNNSKYGPRFFDVKNMYNKKLRSKIQQNIHSDLLEGSILVPKFLRKRTKLEKEILSLSETNIKGSTKDIFAGALTAKHAGIRAGAILYFDTETNLSEDILLI